MITKFIKTLSKGAPVAMATIVILLCANIASLLNSSFHDALYGAISSAIPKSWAAESVKSKYDAEVKTHKQTKLTLAETELELGDTKARLESEIALNKKNRTALDAVDTKSNKNRAKSTEISNKIAQRLARNTSVNMLSVPAESVPIYGVGVVAAATAMDLNDACQTMKDLNNLMIEIGLNKNNADETIICGRRLPSSKEVMSDIQENIENISAWTQIFQATAANKMDPVSSHHQDFQLKFGGYIASMKEKISSKWWSFTDIIGGVIYEMLH